MKYCLSFRMADVLSRPTHYWVVWAIVVLTTLGAERVLALPPDPVAGEKVFVINNCIVDINEFQKLVKSASRLKPFGRVQVNISTLAERSFYEIPKERSPWYDYASDNSTPYKFFPHARLSPHLPAASIAKNRQLLLAKAKILKDNGLEAAFFGSEPNMIPRAFFDANPELLGPRVDHPRRSNHAAFTPCIDHTETLDMYTTMMTEMLKAAPGIRTFQFKTNDAGTGICWADWLYPGPNGPSTCMHKAMGDRVATLMNSFRKGAEQAGVDLDIYMSDGSSNFSDEERDEIQAKLPPGCFFRSTEQNEIINAGGGIGSSYPISGLTDPYAIVNSLRSLEQGKRQTIFINFRSWYSKGNENAEAMDVTLEVIEDYMRQKQQPGNVDTEAHIRRIAERWAGAADAEKLFQAFAGMRESSRFKRALGNILPINWNVAARLVNRPLVVAPQRLTKQEEAYFLPYVFNVSESEARMDYVDIQGARWTTKPDSTGIYFDMVMNVCKMLESIQKTAPRYKAIQDLSMALRIDASFARSCGNFAAAQVIRDKHADKLSGPVHYPNKIPTWTGDEDLLKFNALMRDELDNTRELIEVLRRGGINLVCRAKTAREEDSFLLGPNLVSQLEKKRKIMLDHWRDIEGYMTTPFK